MELILTAEPHFVPGYTGYCPQYIYRIGDTFGTTTHKLLIDPCVSHAEDLTLSNRNKDDYHIDRPTLREIDLIRAHEKAGDPIYKHPTIPGYEGFIPNLTSKIGGRYSIAATEGIAEFEKHMLNLKCEARKLKHRSALQEENAFGRSLGERSLLENDYRLPLRAVRPDAEGVIRGNGKDVDLPDPPPLPYSKSTPPHFMENDDPEKKIIKGFGGHIPYAWPLFGQSNTPLTNSALCDFTNNYQHRRSVEWSPITNTGVGTSSATGPTFEVYVKTTGIVPSYAGHVPGNLFRFGHTFGFNSVDAKRAFNNF